MTPSTTRSTIPLKAREFAFVDPSVADLAVLLRGMRPQMAVSVLSGAEPTSREMARVLAQHQEIDVLHVIAHGRPGELSFAGGALTIASLDDHRADLAQIGLALAADGEIRLWVCEAAAGDEGAAFIDALARSIGVPVAASAGRVGAAAHGGSWTLDARANGPVLPPLTPGGIAAYPGVLATFFATVFTDFYPGTGVDDTFFVTATQQIQAADLFNGNGGFDTIHVFSSFGESFDLTAAAADGVKGFLDIEEIRFDHGSGSGAQTTIRLNANQFGAGKIATDSTITGSIGVDHLIVDMSEPGSFDLASLFFNWDFDVDTVTVNGSSGADEITFDNVPAEILAGAGDDTLIYQQTTAVWAGQIAPPGVLQERDHVRVRHRHPVPTVIGAAEAVAVVLRHAVEFVVGDREHVVDLGDVPVEPHTDLDEPGHRRGGAGVGVIVELMAGVADVSSGEGEKPGALTGERHGFSGGGEGGDGSGHVRVERQVDDPAFESLARPRDRPS